MSADGFDTTAPDFPTYAELTRADTWVTGMTNLAVTAVAPPSVSPTDRYAETTVLGVGGMGKVVLARDARIGRDVALKELRTDRGLGDAERERFLREARVQGQLEHPSIVPVYDIDRRPDGTTFFTMRRVLGKTLHTIIDDLARGDAAAIARHTQRELLTAFATICLTIDYAHSRGVIHRDLKPANLMLGDFGEVYVLDWGLARLVDEIEPAAVTAARISSPGMLMGTPQYMAPEQMEDSSVGPSADVFSLGAMLFELLTFLPLRMPDGAYDTADARPSVRAPHRAIAPELETICVRATAEDPAQRYPTARALQEDVARYLDGDRAVAQRKALAAGHARIAHEAMARANSTTFEEAQSVAVRELNLALALDPTEVEYATVLGQLLTTAPRTTPPEVARQVADEDNRVVRQSAKYWVLGTASWFLFLPALFVMGVRGTTSLAAATIAVAASAAMGIAAVVARTAVIPFVVQGAAIGLMLVASMILSRLFGPLVLMPTLLVSYAAVIQVHPTRGFRTFGMVACAVCLFIPTMLEALGVLPPSYSFVAGRWVIEPQMIELSSTGVQLFLAVFHLTVVLIPAVYIGRLRGQLSEIQTRLQVQAWQFKRLAARV